jgi:uncharacterized lipoprotein YajG
MFQAGFTKFLMNEDPLIGTSLSGPSGSGRIELINARITLRQNSVNRFVINNNETYSFSPSLLNYSYKSNTELANFFNSVNRFSIGATSCILKSPSTNSSMTLTDASTELYVASSLRFASDATETKILSPDINVSILLDSAIRLEATINSFALLTDTLYQCTLGTIDRFYADIFKSTLNYNGTNYVSVNASNLDLVKNGGVRMTIADNYTNTYSPSGIMNTVQADVSYTISGGGSTGPRLIITPTDLSFNLNNITRIHSDASHSQLISPDGLQAVEANNNGVQINLGSNNYKLPTTRGTVGQVLTYSGINTTWASPSASNNAGFSLFNPLESTGTIGSGNKPYWYICMVPCNTVLTGFKTVLSTGSDPFHVGIYRGRTPNNASTILDLLSPITTPAGSGYYSNAFAIQAGRSNVYAAGEYITIMYHSQGSTNVFYNFIGISDTAIAYTSSANYGNATPPANLGSVPVLGTIANRLAIEFY